MGVLALHVSVVPPGTPPYARSAPTAAYHTQGKSKLPRRADVADVADVVRPGSVKCYVNTAHRIPAA
eukprot:1257934-Rhodomonas_salina.4